MIRGIIFDLDGTLLDTLDDLANALNYMLKRKGLPLKSKEEIRYLLGYGALKIVTDSLPVDSKSDEIDECLNIFLNRYAAHQNDFTRPYDDIIYLLEELKNKYKLAIVSNKVDNVVKQLNNDVFHGLIDLSLGEIQGVPVKPHPAMINMVIEKLNLTKHQVIYVGDSEVDILTAKNSGLRSIGVTWGFRSIDTLIANKADHIISTPFELLKLLDKLNN